MAATMRDVAEKVGVSVRTVSRVVNDQGEISAATRQRIKEAIEELGYQPNTLARGLVSGKTSTIAVIIPQITDPFFPEFVQGVESIARAHQYSVFLCNTDENPDQELAYISVFAGKQVDGLILCGTRLSLTQLHEISQQLNVAIVTSRTPKGAALINIPGESGICMATSHLIAQGHQAIGYLGFELPGESARTNGYRRALREHGLAVDPSRIRIVDRVTIEQGAVAAAQILTADPAITAIACYNDLLAIGALRACTALGRRVPADLAIVGFDDIALASLVCTPLTTVRVPRFQVGEAAMNLLLRVMGSDDVLETRQDVALELVVRSSCGAHVENVPFNSEKGIKPNENH